MSKPGIKDVDGKVPMHLLCPAHLVDMARVRAFGSEKYKSPWGWTDGDSYTNFYDAAIRHLLAWVAGEDLDPESGLPHIAHAAVSLMFIAEFQRSGRGLDNRPRGLLSSPSAVKGASVD
jgi:hypothetical protein